MEFLFSLAKTIVHSDHPLFSRLHYLLVTHPRVQTFEWHQGQTFGSSLTFLTLTVLLYLTLTFLLSRYLPSTASAPPRLLRILTALHNTILLSLSAVMAVGCSLSIVSHAPNVDYIVCFPQGTLPKGPLFFWAHVFYLSKIYEYVDTLLIILSTSMSRRLTFLHVYHHATVVVMCYISLHTAQSMYPAVLVTNSAVHVVMYLYYLMCSLGKRPKWKKLVTDCQIVQFYSSFGIMAWIFYYHFTGSGCSGIWGWCFDAVFIASLLFLFLDFHANNYSNDDKKKKKKKKMVNGVEQVVNHEKKNESVKEA
ncbi:Putative elongation of fatty acids protein DDB_G0272012 [Linum perenne]